MFEEIHQKNFSIGGMSMRGSQILRLVNGFYMEGGRGVGPLQPFPTFGSGEVGVSRGRDGFPSFTRF